MPVCSSTSSIVSVNARTAHLKTLRPSICMYCRPAAISSGVAGQRVPPTGICSSGPPLPSDPI
jgi:hypothetical protein